MGVLIIQRGYLQYFNKKFQEFLVILRMKFLIGRNENSIKSYILMIYHI